MTDSAPQRASDAPPTVAARQHWLSVLAQAPREALLRLDGDVCGAERFESLRLPETGLAMVRARIANTGNRYHLGEATLTRCALRHREGVDGHVSVGLGYVLGRDRERSLAMARLDALLQHPTRQADLLAAVVVPLQAAIDARHLAEAAHAAPSRVRFHTLQPAPAP